MSSGAGIKSYVFPWLGTEKYRMRCLVNLTAMQKQVYSPSYHVKLQGAMYDILSDAGYGFVHRERPFKFVTFSNVFPPEDMEAGDNRTWLLASPNEELITAVARTIADRHVLEVGDRRYRIRGTSTFEITPDETGGMETATPVIVRIPAGRCDQYGIKNEANYDDVYWRLDHPEDAFVQEVERNLAAKYRAYYDAVPPDRPYFTDLRPQKEVAIPLQYDETTVQTIGTTWEFDYQCRTRQMYRLIKLAYSAGVGELNTTGFGFVNELSG